MEKRGISRLKKLILWVYKICFVLDRPAAPYPPTIIESSINSTSLILTWRKDSDFNYAPIRYTLIEYEENEISTWKSYDPMNKPDGQITTLLIQK